MKLPDFKQANILNDLRAKMNAELIDSSTILWTPIDTDDLLDRLNRHEGIEVNSSELTFCPDGTFDYMGQKVLIYIRDQRMNPRYGRGEYKFHVSTCEVIDKFIQNNRINRYVVSTRTDGKFVVNVVNTSSNQYIEKNVIKELKVCKMCLLRLRYKGYSDHKFDISIYNEFSLQEFFKNYRTIFEVKPKHTDMTAPPDLYTNDSQSLHDKIKTYNEWKCQSCGINLINNKKYLHIHHMNGVKSDDRIENLKCLCIKCHSDQPDHFH